MPELISLYVIAASIVVVLILAALLLVAGISLRKLFRNLSARQDQAVEQSISPSLDEMRNLTNQLARGLGELQERSQQVQQATQEILSLQELLRPPKLRGVIGELLLEQLLEQVLATGQFSTQFTFQDGTRVDAVVLLQGKKVPIDSKFPLEGFNKILSATTEEEAIRRRRDFHRSVRTHVDSVAKYIRPSEGTFNFGLMYIPAENIYYELIVRQDESELGLHQYALERNVVPVSPNSLYLYLQTVALGLMGLQIEGQAQEVWNLLTSVARETERLLEHDVRILGRHLKNTQEKYDDVRRGMEHLSGSLALTRRGGPINLIANVGSLTIPTRLSDPEKE